MSIKPRHALLVSHLGWWKKIFMSIQIFLAIPVTVWGFGSGNIATIILSPGDELQSGLIWHGILFLVFLPVFLWTLFKKRSVNKIDGPGFEIITPSEKRTYIPLEDKFQHLDFLSKVETLESLRLSANLNKVNLSFRRFGYLLEDKNFRNALLVNRRRVRRTMLRDCDVLDIGDLILMYRDDRQPAVIRNAAVTPPEGKSLVKFERVRGPVRKGTPMLVSEQHPNRQFYITKNLVYLGRSENNDLIIKAKNVDYSHAKVERVGGRYKLIDLSFSGNTFVNNRRIEQRILRDGDELSIDNQRFKFQLVTKALKSPSFTSLPRTDSREPDGEEMQTEEDSQTQ